jgi:hypothetical protein
LLRHKIRAHTFGGGAITCKLRIPVLLCHAAMLESCGWAGESG